MNVLLIRPNTPKQSINLQSFMICEPLELEYVASSLLENHHQVDLVAHSLEKALMLGKIEGRRRRGQQRMK